MIDTNHISLPDAFLSPDILRFSAALEKAGFSMRFIGGCVRDFLVGIPIQDIDLATDATPDEMCRVFSAAKIPYKPTGIDHGTLTLLGKEHKKAYEITSLRTDVETDGRHATVAYTRDWEEDAKRRDLTINALSVDMAGQLYDYVGGRQDLANGHVRFIGNPADRIEEDYLRLLRFFRFYALFGRKEPDEETLHACMRYAPQLSCLSKERVGRETLKWLKAQHVLPSLELADRYSVLPYIFPDMGVGALFRTYYAYEQTKFVMPCALARLHLLLPADIDAKEISDKLRLSRREKKCLLLFNQAAYVTPENSTNFLLRRVGNFQKDCLSNFFFLALVLHKKIGIPKDWLDFLIKVERFKTELFPLSGHDLIQNNICKKGLETGRMLAFLKKAWLESETPLSADALLHMAKKNSCQ